MKKTQIFYYLVLAIAALSFASCCTTGYTYTRYGVATPVVTYADPCAPAYYDDYSSGLTYRSRLSYNSSGYNGYYDYGTGTQCSSSPCYNTGHYHDYNPNGYHGPRQTVGSNTPDVVNGQRPNVQKQSVSQKSSSHKFEKNTVNKKRTTTEKAKAKKYEFKRKRTQ